MNEAACSHLKYQQIECHYSKDDFEVLAAFALRHFGLSMPDSKMSMVYTRLWHRLRARGLNDFGAYCSLIDDPSETEERLALLSALTTNVTRFFREPHHFKTLQEIVLPPLIEAAETGKRIRAFILDAGPNLDSSFRIEGTVFDRVIKEGIELPVGNAGGWGS